MLGFRFEPVYFFLLEFDLISEVGHFLFQASFKSVGGFSFDPHRFGHLVLVTGYRNDDSTFQNGGASQKLAASVSGR